MFPARRLQYEAHLQPRALLAVNNNIYFFTEIQKKVIRVKYHEAFHKFGMV